MTRNFSTYERKRNLSSKKGKRKKGEGYWHLPKAQDMPASTRRYYVSFYKPSQGRGEAEGHEKVAGGEEVCGW